MTEAGQAEAGRREQGRDVVHYPGVREEEADPRTHGCPAAETQGCPGGLRNRAGAGGVSDTREADRRPTAGRLTGSAEPEERGKHRERRVISEGMIKNTC